MLPKLLARIPFLHVWAFHIALAGVSACRGADRVVAQARTGDTAPLTLVGTIEDFTGQRLTIREEESRRPRALTADTYRILTIQTTYLPVHELGVRHLGEERFPEAETALSEALDAEPRRWVRREILAQLIRTRLGKGDRVGAGHAFLKLVESDPVSPHFRLIPLRWIAGGGVGPSRLSAREWLRSESEIAQLMGASQLLDDPEFGKDAESILRSLVRSADIRIQSLAIAQQWRIDLSREVPGDPLMSQWADRAERMPADLRGGPMHVLGRARAARIEHELAAAAFLWHPLNYRDDPELAARGLLEAGRSLSLVGQERSAVTVWSELHRRFPKSGDAEEAAGLEAKMREALRQPASGADSN